MCSTDLDPKADRNATAGEAKGGVNSHRRCTRLKPAGLMRIDKWIGQYDSYGVLILSTQVQTKNTHIPVKTNFSTEKRVKSALSLSIWLQSCYTF
ncbi:hypothetical protein GCM10023333_22120 [Ferrimonas pelagia]|uniref:Transposase n=1 Tax=Ferrimonas pelagia TaxID=1177826 RepID=A0ABP9EVU7_9GAMM